MVSYTPQILEAIAAGPGQPTAWEHWPGGWRNEIDTALVDAVFSVRATYKTKNPNRGVLAGVNRWRARRLTTDSLQGLVAEISAVSPARWAVEFGNQQLAPSRRQSAPGGPTKAAAVLEAAGLLVSSGVEHAADVTSDSAADVRACIRRVPGIGTATSAYFTMLLGYPGVKPDVMIHRFLTDVTGERLSDDQAISELTAAAAELGVSATDLEHAIWSWQRATTSAGR
jgi:hypothetical protein